MIACGIFICLSSCKSGNEGIIAPLYVDSLIKNYSEADAIKANDDDIRFWKARIVNNTPQFMEPSKYGAALKARFSLLGDIADMKKADSILYAVVAAFNGKESSPYLSLSMNAITEHRFKDADSLLTLAKTIGIKKYEGFAASFDVDFELARIPTAEYDLKNMYDPGNYGYQFRQSKMMHYKGDMDSSISAMQKAADLAGPDMTLRGIALSNVGDLYIHAGKPGKAYDCYRECIKLNAIDLHSIMGIGWIALVHDKNNSMAEKIFSFVAGKTQSPEPLFKLACAAEQGSDSAKQMRYAKAFAEKASAEMYGTMYNKYLLQLYIGILNEPAAALAITQKELTIRATPQTYSWYAWALINNNKPEEAYKIYEQYISGKPLEGLELYWMGKMMQKLGKGYNAEQFFSEAKKSKYDLSPAEWKDLEASAE